MSLLTEHPSKHGNHSQRTPGDDDDDGWGISGDDDDDEDDWGVSGDDDS